MKFHLPKFLAIAATIAILSPLSALALPGPDLKMQKTCHLDPPKGPQAVYCVLDVTNIGTVPSVSPITITDNPVGPPGTTFTSSNGSFACTTPVGPLPPVISCGAPYSLVPSPASGSAGQTFLYFNVAAGGTFSNCATVGQGSNAATPKDPQPGQQQVLYQD